VSDVLEQPAAVPGDDPSETTPDQRQDAIPRQQVRSHLERTQARMFLVTTIVLAAGLGLLWLTKTVVGIEGDAVFIALLLVPVIVYLAMTDRLQSFSFGGASAVFRGLEEVQGGVDRLHGTVQEVGEREAERAAYLGKLGQVLEEDEDGRKFALIYADVDGLREVVRELYTAERDRTGDKSGTPADRKQVGKIRDEVIDRLEFALTDAFYDAGLGKAKCDVFRLEEPDVAMIVRTEEPHRAHQIAERAEGLFREAKGCTATTAVVPATYLAGELTPKSVDDVARRAIKQAKDERTNRR
jgi:hypothetical protein